MIKINLSNSPNQSIKLDIDTGYLELLIRENGFFYTADVRLNGEDLVLGVRLIMNNAVVSPKSKQGIMGGNLYFYSDTDSVIESDKFNGSQSLYFVTIEEIEKMTG